ncbi:MAG: hypothetical protein COB51_13350 [Moraxellaceae bacterium]|nr:MAG: hypothetical protein COB51_13350 [Moraxellaceae bacterium]
MTKSIFAAAICALAVLVTVIDAVDLVLSPLTKHGPVQVLSYHKHPVLFIIYLAVSIPLFGGIGYLLCWSVIVNFSQKKEDGKQLVLMEQKKKEKQAHLEQLKQQRQSRQKKPRGKRTNSRP